MSTPTTTGGADPKKTADTTKWWSICGAVAILIIVWLLTPSSSNGRADKPGTPNVPSTQVQPQQPTSGHTNIVHNEWRGVQCLENGMRITAFILKPGVRWQVRFDYRDDQVYDLYPMDYKTNSMLVITNSYKVQEWRIKPGDKAISAPVAWKITSENVIPSR